MTDRSAEIPTEFSLKDQLEEITSVYKSRSDFIEGRTRKRVMGSEERNLQLYSLARIKAIGRTIRKLLDEEESKSQNRVVDEDGF